MSRKQVIASAIKRLAGEHGLPNNFAVSEIAQVAGLPNLTVGSVLKSSADEIGKIAGYALLRHKQDRTSYISVQQEGAPDA